MQKYILPVFAVLPFSASFCEERRNRAVAYIVSREGMRRYGAVKYIVNILMGGLVVAFGTALLILFLRMSFPMTSDYYETSAADTADLFHKWLAVHSPVRYCMTEAALGFMRGMIWAGASMFVSLYLTLIFFSVSPPETSTTTTCLTCTANINTHFMNIIPKKMKADAEKTSYKYKYSFI